MNCCVVLEKKQYYLQTHKFMYTNLPIKKIYLFIFKKQIHIQHTKQYRTNNSKQQLKNTT